jgi:hypothetical protein
LKKLLLAGAMCVAALMSGASANAAVMFNFQPGGASPTSGYVLINTFDTDAGITGSGFQIKVPPADDNGAPPANSVPSGTPYLSVLGGGMATITFASAVSAFQFDWGSIDAYNTLTINSTGQDPVIVPGSNFINPADGNQVSPGTNGLFTVYGTAGETFNSITLSSSGNSFEVDNLAVSAVPEPAAWALMIAGFGLTGVALRRRRRIGLAAL